MKSQPSNLRQEAAGFWLAVLEDLPGPFEELPERLKLLLGSYCNTLEFIDCCERDLAIKGPLIPSAHGNAAKVKENNDALILKENPAISARKKLLSDLATMRKELWGDSTPQDDDEDDAPLLD